MSFAAGKTFVAAVVLGLFYVSFAHAVTTVNVPAGGNIHNAVATVKAAGGGTVNLASGGYTVTAPIKIPGNITISGAGTPATTITAKGRITLFINEAEGQTNMTIKNMKLVGDPLTTDSHGIVIASLNVFHSKVTISNVQIMNFGGMGCHLKRVNGITISGCNIHHNGNFGYMHNLYIRTVTAVNISATNLNNSGAGTGLHIAGAGCSNITMTGVTATGNATDGMHVQDTPAYVSILSCNTSSNRRNGLSLTGTNMEVDRNTCNSNTGTGIYTWGGNGTISNNTATGNGAGNYNIHGQFTLTNNK